jgi:tRNA threonylcarbamoyladenosine dehydratase
VEKLFNLYDRPRMSGWLQEQALSQRVQLIATAVLSGFAVASTILSVQALRRKIAIEDLKASIPNSEEDPRVQRVSYLRTLVTCITHN